MGKKTDIFAVSFILFFVAGFAALTVSDTGILEQHQASAELEEYAVMIEPIQSTLDEVNQKLDTLESDTMIELQKLQAEIESIKIMEAEEENLIEQPTETTNENESEIIETENSSLVVHLDKEEYLPGDMIKVTGTAQENASLSAKLINPENEILFSVNSNAGNDGSYTIIFMLDSEIETGAWNVVVQHIDAKETVPFTVKTE